MQELLEKLPTLEEIEIELARKVFYDFCVYMDPKFFTPAKKHLKQIADAFQQVADGFIKYLAVSIAPRAGKSYVTSLFCAWMFGKYPDDASIMRNSYAAKLAEKFSKDIRDGIIPNEKYKKVFPNVVASGAIDNWYINGRTQPSYFCGGVGGPITGFGCKTIAILDDPIKNIEEALSETVIDNTWNWYTSTHLSRLETGCPEIHIATRWTKKDPIGRLTDPESETYNSEFEIINIPALNDDGTSFCEEIKTTEEYHKIKKVTEDFIWEAEYMQHPVEAKGLLFPVEELNRFSMKDLAGKEPDGVIGYTDTADKGDDYLSSPVGCRYGDYTYITDVVFTQDGVEVTEPLVAKLMIDSKCKTMNVESNNGGESFGKNVQKIIKDIAKELKEDYHLQCKAKAAELDGYYVYSKTTTQNKETRILMNAGYIKEYFYFRNDYEAGSDYDKFMRQLTSYVKLGKNKHDDAADSITGLGEYMQNNFYIPPVKAELPKNKWYTEDELEDMGYSKRQIKRYKEMGIEPWNTV